MECVEENEIVIWIYVDVVEKIGGLFVVILEDDLEFFDQWVEGVKKFKVFFEEIFIVQVLCCEFCLNFGIKCVFVVQDGLVDGWQMVWGVVYFVIEYGVKVMIYIVVIEIICEGDQIIVVVVYDFKYDEQICIDCKFVINIVGLWVGCIVEFVGCYDVDVVLGCGIMIVMNYCLVNMVVNCCIYFVDGDILVLVYIVLIIGIIDVKVDDLEWLVIFCNEVQQMFDFGEVFVFGFCDVCVVYVWVGVCLLFKDK